MSVSLLSLLTLLISAVTAAPFAERDEAISTTVDLGYAKYQGLALDAGVNQYLGMRYAAPPLEDLRFRAPADPAVDTAVQDASAFRPICVGTSQTVSTSEAEDCLFINVFTPTNATTSSKLPVWFYIQGGGYATNANANYNGTDVIMTSGYDIILVNFNYRVGALGFLASEKVRENGDLNAGLLDERKALEWVQKYISLFGGDPDHVVIHGASAGAGSVAYHLTAYGGRNDHLFVGAVGESVFFPTHRTVPESEFQFNRFVEDTGCANSTTTDPLTCLRGLDIATIQAANVPSPFPGAASDEPLPLWYFLPCIDGTFSIDYQYNLFSHGQFVKVPIIFGDDTNEGSAFAVNAANASEVSVFLKNNYPKLNSIELRLINDFYPLMPPLPDHAAYFPSASAAYGDSTFTCPGNFITESMSRYSAPSSVWNYRFNVLDAANTADGLGVPHTFETAAIFGVGYSGSNGVGTGFQTYNADIIPVVMDYWISFVKSLNPNTNKDVVAPLWDNFDGGRRLKFQTNQTAMESIPLKQFADCALWRGLAVVMEQ